jgi:hypothetical protein
MAERRGLYFARGPPTSAGKLKFQSTRLHNPRSCIGLFSLNRHPGLRCVWVASCTRRFPGSNPCQSSQNSTTRTRREKGSQGSSCPRSSLRGPPRGPVPRNLSTLVLRAVISSPRCKTARCSRAHPCGDTACRRTHAHRGLCLEPARGASARRLQRAGSQARPGFIPAGMAGSGGEGCRCLEDEPNHGVRLMRLLALHPRWPRCGPHSPCSSRDGVCASTHEHPGACSRSLP